MSEEKYGSGSPLPMRNEMTTGIYGKDRAVFFLILILFLVAGAIGHDPWGKKEEPYLFGIIYEFYVSHSWLIPKDAGVPFMEKPPLYAWIAVVLCDALNSLLPLYDAARLTSVLCMCLALTFLWKTSQTVFHGREERRGLGWICLLLFAGTYGVAHWAHEMITDIPLLAGTCVALHGMALFAVKPESWKRAGMWFGIGMGIAFLSKGVFVPLVFVLSGLVIGFTVHEIRRHATIRAIALTVVVSAPFFLIWPLWLYHSSPSLFMEWFWENNIGRFFGFTVQHLGARNDRCHTLAIIPLYAFPVFPLACIELYCRRKDWRMPEYLIPSVIIAVGLLVLLTSASARAPYFLPLYPMLALLAAPSLLRFRPVVLVFWNYAVRIAFSLIGLGLWLVWWNLRHDPEHRPIPWLVRRFDHIYSADFIPPMQSMEVAIAFLVAVIWCLFLRIKGMSPLNTARIWFAGVAMLWCTCYTLLLPWENETRSYRTAIKEMQDFVDNSSYAGKCIAAYRLGENMSPMVEYYMQRTTPLPIINLDSGICPLFLTFSLRDEPADIDPRWHMAWRGTRLKDIKIYELRLYERKI